MEVISQLHGPHALSLVFCTTAKSLPLLETEPQLLGCLIQSLVYQATQYKIWHSLSGIRWYYGVRSIPKMSRNLYPEMGDLTR
jgi:hypothetical protein